jgi:hypothetical protein
MAKGLAHYLVHNCLKFVHVSIDHPIIGFALRWEKKAITRDQIKSSEKHLKYNIVGLPVLWTISFFGSAIKGFPTAESTGYAALNA